MKSVETLHCTWHWSFIDVQFHSGLLDNETLRVLGIPLSRSWSHASHLVLWNFKVWSIAWVSPFFAKISLRSFHWLQWCFIDVQFFNVVSLIMSMCMCLEAHLSYSQEIESVYLTPYSGISKSGVSQYLLSLSLRFLTFWWIYFALSSETEDGKV